jgi:hypothetical protein
MTKETFSLPLGRAGEGPEEQGLTRNQKYNMSRMTALIIAALIIAAILFAVSYWGFGQPLSFSVNIALSGALGGMVAEMVRRRMERKKQNKI